MIADVAAATKFYNQRQFPATRYIDAQRPRVRRHGKLLVVRVLVATIDQHADAHAAALPGAVVETDQ